MKTRIYVVTLADNAALIEAKSAAGAMKLACDDLKMTVAVATPKDVANLMKQGVTLLRDKNEPQQPIAGA